MGLPFFSIVTISFNQSRYLRQCLDSVISQKSNDVEYIVVGTRRAPLRAPLRS